MDVLVQCGECLRKLHAIGVVHRDVKPDNFLLTRNVHDGSVRAVISDFGLSSDRSGKNINTNCGTTSFKAPEIVKNTWIDPLHNKVTYVGCVPTVHFSTVEVNCLIFYFS